MPAESPFRVIKGMPAAPVARQNLLKFLTESPQRSELAFRAINCREQSQ